MKASPGSRSSPLPWLSSSSSSSEGLEASGGNIGLEVLDSGGTWCAGILGNRECDPETEADELEGSASGRAPCVRGTAGSAGGGGWARWGMGCGDVDEPGSDGGLVASNSPSVALAMLYVVEGRFAWPRGALLRRHKELVPN